MKTETDDRLSSMMLWNGAKEYMEAARALFEHEKNESSFIQIPSKPAYFLICQSIELALKAYLRGSGKDEDCLVSKCKHNLAITLTVAEECGLANLLKFEPAELAMLDLANKLYSSKALQFAIVGLYTYPRFELLLAITEKLVAETKAFCIENVERHAGKSTAVVTLRSARRR